MLLPSFFFPYFGTALHSIVSLRVLYDSYSNQIVDNDFEHSATMDIREWILMLEIAELEDSDFTQRECYLSFCFGQMLTIDEVRVKKGTKGASQAT